MQADHQQRLAPPEIDGSSAISIPSSAIHQQGRLFASGAAWVGGGTVGNHAISGTTSPNNDGGDNSSGSNVLWINGSGGSPGMYGTTGNGGIPRHTGTSAPLLPLPQLPGSFMSGAGTGTLALDSIQPVASRSRHGHDPSARVRVGVEDMGRKEMKDPRRARATQRGRGAEDPRGGRRDWEEHKQGNTLLGSRVEAQAPGQDTAVQGSQGDTERGVSGSGQGGAREEGIIDETDWRPRGRNSTSGVRQDQQPRKWQPYPGRGRGFRRGDRGRGRTQGNRGRGRGNDDSVGGSGSHVGEHFRDKHKSEVIERRSLAQSASSKIESHDTDRNNGRRQASERERTSSLAPRGRKAVREDFTDDRERSRSPSVGQDRGPTVAPAPISPSTGTLPSASTCVSQPSPAPTTARELFPESSHPRQLNYAMAIASNHPPPSSAVPQPLSHPHSLDAVQPTIYPSPIKKKGITLPVAPLPPIRTSLQQLGAPLPAAVPTSPSPTPPKQATSPPREIVVIPDSAATSRTVASTSKPAASLTITPRTASTIMGELDSSICADQAGGGLKRPGRVVNKEPVPLRSMKRVRVSEAKPASQAAPIFSSDDETPEQSVKITANNELRGEWPHEFKFLLEAKDRVCSVCEKDFVRICTACSKCVECVRNGNKECVVGASQERRHSPPPQGSAVQRDWPEYPKTVTRLDIQLDHAIQ